MSIMKTTFAIAVLALTAQPAFADNWDGNPDMERSILNEHRGGYVGTSFVSGAAERGGGDSYGSILHDIQAGERHVPHQSGDSHAPEKGNGDTYGSVLND
jgi:hypothetical protein